ncbi:unnamed protein product [Clavelina lepadiformis]|uniref:FERM domain-containing protein n=1 Tax=Clavelina lepadiformis TaxID=159417 RepID=A0ABP0FCL8_CLALP
MRGNIGSKVSVRPGKVFRPAILNSPSSIRTNVSQRMKSQKKDDSNKKCRKEFSHSKPGEQVLQKSREEIRKLTSEAVFGDAGCSHQPNIREIRCLKCSCIGNIHLVEHTEDVIDALRKRAYSCNSHFLAALHYTKKKRHLTHFDRNNIADRTELVQQCLRYNLTAESPPYERRILNLKQTTHTGNEVPYRSGLTDSHCAELSEANYSPKRANKFQDSTLEPGPLTTGPRSLESFNELIQADTDDCADIVCRKSSEGFCKTKTSICVSQSKPETNCDKQALDNSINILSTLYSHRKHRPSAVKMKSNSGKKPVRVHLLNGESILLVFDCKAIAKEVFDQVCTMHSIKESHFFGLSAVVEKEHRFMDLKQRLSKYAPKEWGKDQKRKEGDISIQPSSVFTVQFQVQYYVEHPKLICNYQSRYHYYLQMKRNVLQSKVVTQDETIVTLAAISLHLDLGAFDPTLHTGRYFDPNEYVPAWFLKKWGENYLWSHLPTMHIELASTSTFNAQADYIKQASTIEDVPVHYYKLFKTKKETEPSVTLGIFNQGIRIHHIAHQRPDGPHLLDFEFPWNKVGRLFFAGKRFEIFPDDLPSSRKLVYYTGSHSRSKYLLQLLRDTHSLFHSLTPFVEHMKKVDGKRCKRMYRESYISGMDLDEKYGAEHSERLVGSMDGRSPGSNKSEKERGSRFKSYNSNTSQGSSHTSGIESDTKQKPEEVDDEEQHDNAFLDDFDPIDVDGPPSSAGIICITDEHLVAPPHKSLSVTDLTEASRPRNSSDVSEQETSIASDTTQSEQTVQNENVATTLACLNEASGPAIPQPTGTSLNKLNASFGSVDGVLLTTNTLPSKLAHLKDNGYPGPSHRQITHTSSKRSDDGFANTKPLGPKVHPNRDLLTTEAVQQPVLVPLSDRPGSNTFYDDIDTIPRTTSHDRHHNGSKKTKKRQHRKSNSADQDQDPVGPIHRSYSTDSAQKSRHRNCNIHDKGSRHRGHRRHVSVQESRDVAEAISPTSPHFGAALTTNKSLDDLRDADQGTLSRSDWRRDIPKAFLSKQDMLDHSPPPPTARSLPSPKASEVDHFLHQRKMSDACQKMLGAQHRKMSSDKLQNNHPLHHHHHRHEQRRRSDFDRTHAAIRSVPNGRIEGPGSTPHKPEVLLRTKQERSHPHKPRPVSYHVTPNINFSPEDKASYCYNDAALTSRLPVYIESFKEVIV